MSDKKRILVTGAGGFIGGWIAEEFHFENVGHVRAGVRNWGGSARLARSRLEIVSCDIMVPTQVERAVEGVDSVIHCAAGPPDVIIDGTRNVLEASKKAGVAKVVYLSTVSVYGDATGIVDESTTLRMTGSSYGDSKIKAEMLCGDYTGKGVPTVILRPSVVYGPYNKLWIAKFAERLRSGYWGIFDALGEGTCNLVYVRDVVSAVRCAMESEAGVGKSFNISGNELITWNEYFSALNGALGLPPLRRISPQTSRARSRLMAPIKKVARFGLSRYGGLIASMYQSSTLVQSLMRRTEEQMKTSPGKEELDMFGRKVQYPITNAISTLGYQPRVPIDKGLRLSVEWLKHESPV